MKQVLPFLFSVMAASLFAATQTVNGITWTYSVSDGAATIESIPRDTTGDITIPSSLGGYPVTSIGDSAFEGCSSLTSVVIPEGVTSIGGRAFWGCSSLTSVVIPEDVTWIKSGAFQYCSLLTSVVIPEGVTVIGGYTFEGCSSLTSVVIPEGVTVIDDYTFRGCSSLTSVVFPESLTSIGNRAFNVCSSLTSVVIPESVTSIGHYAFSGCSSLTSVVIPEGVTTIGGSAFEGCISLTSVVIPESVTSIGNSAFYNCSLTSLQFQGPPPEGVNNVAPNVNFYFPQKYGAAWEKVLGGKRTTVSDVIVSNQAKVDVRAEMTTPKTMKVSYTVTSDLPSVKVRAVAFKDGVRSFANIVPVRTGEGVPQGESVKTNVEHTFVWEVANDWDTDLDKVAVEILVQGDTLLPQEQLTIPATETHKAMTITRNALMEPWLFNALVWCFAEGDERLLVQYGRVFVDNVVIARNDRLPNSPLWMDEIDNTGHRRTWKDEATALLNYLYGKMGYKVLAGEDLAYAERATRLDFASEGLGQVSVKIDEGE